LPTTVTIFSADWIEPGSTRFNFVGANGTNRLSVMSDTTLPALVTVADGNPIGFGTADDEIAITAVFHDLGDVPTPLPAALPLFATGLGALGLLGWRRKRKAQAVA
jgi:hypothetical protein